MVWNFSCKLAFCTLCHSCYLWFHFVKVGPSCVGLRLKSNLHMHFIDFSTIWSNVSTEAVRNNSNLNSVLTPISLRSLVRSSLSCFLLLQNVNKDYYLQKKPAPPWWRTWFRSRLRIWWKSWVWDFTFHQLRPSFDISYMISHQNLLLRSLTSCKLWAVPSPEQVFPPPTCDFTSAKQLFDK